MANLTWFKTLKALSLQDEPPTCLLHFEVLTSAPRGMAPPYRAPRTLELLSSFLVLQILDTHTLRSAIRAENI